MPTTQSYIIEAMSRPDFYPHPVAGVVHLQTHISHVFLTGEVVYKIKKPLEMGFLDFASLDSRRRYCLEELRLNRRLAPEIYQAVLGVFQRDGSLALDALDSGRGALVEVCLRMKEMSQERMMDRMLQAAAVTPGHIDAIAERLAAFYRAEKTTPEIAAFGRVAQVRHNVEENFEQTRAHQGLAVAPPRWRAVRDFSLAFLDQHQELLRRRVEEGRIIDGHGDLHAGNINLPAPGGVHIFDCIEFNRRFRYQDPACDVAFLAMELEFHQQPDLSQRLVQQISRRLDDPGLAELIDFYKCYRAVVRAKVNGFMLDDPEVAASQRRHDLELARDYWRLAAGYTPGEPAYFLVCFMGLMGTGKSYRAAWLSRATGWDHLRSDQVRKELAGLAPSQRRYEDYGQGIYNNNFTRATYQALAQRAEAHLAQGLSVIVDASFQRDRWREEFVDLARRHGAEVLLVEVGAERTVVQKRLRRREARGDDASDGRVALMDRQAAGWEDTGRWAEQGLLLRLDGAREADESMGPVMSWLRKRGYRQ